jgi:hypothetical protein
MLRLHLNLFIFLTIRYSAIHQKHVFAVNDSLLSTTYGKYISGSSSTADFQLQGFENSYFTYLLNFGRFCCDENENQMREAKRERKFLFNSLKIFSQLCSPFLHDDMLNSTKSISYQSFIS